MSEVELDDLHGSSDRRLICEHGLDPRPVEALAHRDDVVVERDMDATDVDDLPAAFDFVDPRPRTGRELERFSDGPCLCDHRRAPLAADSASDHEAARLTDHCIFDQHRSFGSLASPGGDEAGPSCDP